MASPDWSNLHTDILLLILRRLPVIDYVRFGAVCVSWNRLAASNLVPPAPQVPWLMLSSRAYYHLATAMYDPFTKKQQCRIRLKIHQFYRFFGSTSDGYMIFHFYTDILLLNPLTRSRITFPSLDTLPGRHDWLSEIRSVAARIKPNTVVAICYTSFHTEIVAFCKAGDEVWTFLNQTPQLNHIILYIDRLYGVTDDRGALLSFDLREDSTCSMITGEDVTDPSYKYLVESTGGDLLKVHRSKDDMVNAVFKLELSSNEWRRVRSIGDDAIMLSFQWQESTRCVCISTQNLPELRPNCVYLVSGYHLPMRVYNIGDGSTEELDLPLGMKMLGTTTLLFEEQALDCEKNEEITHFISVYMLLESKNEEIKCAKH